MQLERVFKMPLGQGSYAVIGKKLGLIQHSLEEFFHAMTAQQRQQPALTPARGLPMRHQAGQIRPMHQEPLQPPRKSGQSFQ